MSVKAFAKNEIRDWFAGLAILAMMGCVGNYVGYKVPILDSLPGMLILFVISIAGLFVTKLIPGKMPAMLYVSVVAILVSMPYTPIAAILTPYVNKINLMAIVTPILAYAGVIVGRDWDAFRKLSWKAVVVGIVVIFGAFFWGALIAEVLIKVT